MNKSLNENVADFEYKGRKYQVDKLLDSGGGDGFTYDIFDVTEDEVSIGFMQLDGSLMSSEIIEKAKEELDKLCGNGE